MSDLNIFRLRSWFNHINYYQPWRPAGVSNSSASCFLLEHNGKNYVVTNAHAVCQTNALLIQRDNRHYTARIRLEAHDPDLAILDVDDPSFYEGIRPLHLGSAAKPADSISLHGYPRGGTNLSVTRGIINRMCPSWSEGRTSMMYFEIDAQVNPGNSGGPILNKSGEVVGVVAGISEQKGTSTNYGMPGEVLRELLDTPEVYHGTPRLPFRWQSLESPSIIKYFNLKDNMGVLIIQLCTLNKGVIPPEFHLNDVVLAVDDRPISCGGLVHEPFYESLVPLDVYIHHRRVGAEVRFKLLRENEVITVAYTLPSPTMVVSNDYCARSVNFLILMGICFSPVTRMAVDQESSLRSGDSFVSYKNICDNGFEVFEEEHPGLQEMIWITEMINTPQTTLIPRQECRLLRFNKVRVFNFRHLHRLVLSIDPLKIPFIDLEFDKGIRIILDLEGVKDVAESSANICAAHGIMRWAHIAD